MFLSGHSIYDKHNSRNSNQIFLKQCGLLIASCAAGGGSKSAVCNCLVSIVALFAGVQIHHHVKKGMRGQLEHYYQWDSRIGKAWNRVQVKVDIVQTRSVCCRLLCCRQKLNQHARHSDTGVASCGLPGKVSPSISNSFLFEVTL